MLWRRPTPVVCQTLAKRARSLAETLGVLASADGLTARLSSPCTIGFKLTGRAGLNLVLHDEEGDGIAGPSHSGIISLECTRDVSAHPSVASRFARYHTPIYRVLGSFTMKAAA